MKLNDYILENTITKKNIPLQAIMEDEQSGVTVHLRGAHLDEHGRDIRSKHDAIANVRPNNKPNDSVLRNGNQHVRFHIEGVSSSIDHKAYYVSDASRRIGILGVHIGSDYKSAPDDVFPVRENAVIDLGRYGPFRRTGKFQVSCLFNLSHLIRVFFRSKKGRIVQPEGTISIDY
jgi:hypothetical protein